MWGGSNECEFKRGICSIHKLKGKKMVTTTKKWVAKKGGYGWSYSRKVTYTCNYLKNTPTGHSVRPTVEYSQSLDKGCSSNRGKNYSNSTDVLEQDIPGEKISFESESFSAGQEVPIAGR